MLTPQKKLSITSPLAMSIALVFANLGTDDVVYNVECINGHFLVSIVLMFAWQPQEEVVASNTEKLNELIAPNPAHEEICSWNGVAVVASDLCRILYTDAAVPTLPGPR